MPHGSGSVERDATTERSRTTPLTAANLPWHILFGFEASMVDTTICAGEVLMRNRELLTLDEAKITARSRELASAVWKRFSD